jgi:hypothetical protein
MILPLNPYFAHEPIAVRPGYKDKKFKVITRHQTKFIHPSALVFPIVTVDRDDICTVQGTGFYITASGLFATAAHLFAEDFADHRKNGTEFVIPHILDRDHILMRPISKFVLQKDWDVCIGQAAPSLSGRYDGSIINHYPFLELRSVPAGTACWTIGYPLNKKFKKDKMLDHDFRPTIRYGRILDLLDSNTNEYRRVPQTHFRTSLQIDSGASGSPVFLENGAIVGVASSGFDFADGEEPLSSILRIPEFITVDISPFKDLPGYDRIAPVGIRGERPPAIADLFPIGVMRGSLIGDKDWPDLPPPGRVVKEL